MTPRRGGRLRQAAFAPTITAMASHEAGSRDWPSASMPISAAKTGFTLMKIPKRCAATLRNALRSTANGTAEESTPAAAAAASGPMDMW